MLKQRREWLFFCLKNCSKEKEENRHVPVQTRTDPIDGSIPVFLQLLEHDQAESENQGFEAQFRSPKWADVR